MREELILEVGTPRAITFRSSARCSAGRRTQVSGEVDRRISVGDQPRRRIRLPHRPEHHPQGVARAGRRCRCDRAVGLPVEVTIQKLGRRWAPTTPNRLAPHLRVVFWPVRETNASPRLVSHGYSSINLTGLLECVFQRKHRAEDRT